MRTYRVPRRPDLENSIWVKRARRLVRQIDRCKVGEIADRDLPRFAPQSLCATKCGTDIKALADRAVLFDHDIAGNVAQALAVFQFAQFLGQADADVAIGSDSKRPACSQPSWPIEWPIAKVGLGDRAKPGNCAAFC